MSNRTLQLLIFLSIAAVVFLLAINFLPYIATKNSELRLNFQDVKGASVVYKGKTFTLNGIQQATLISALNAAIPIGRAEFTPEALPDYGQFEIYFFKKEEKLTLKPVGIVGKNLVFKVPEWNRDGWIRDVTDGGLYNLLKDSHPDDQPINGSLNTPKEFLPNDQPKSAPLNIPKEPALNDKPKISPFDTPKESIPNDKPIKNP